jgi:predicted porin
VRRWLVAIVILALAAGAAFSAYLWYTHENGIDGIERAVIQRLNSHGISAERVSCAKDHTAPAGSMTATFYRCDLHGADNGGDAQSEVCVIFIAGRLATVAEGMLIPFEEKFC